MGPEAARALTADVLHLDTTEIENIIVHHPVMESIADPPGNSAVAIRDILLRPHGMDSVMVSRDILLLRLHPMKLNNN